MGNEACNGKYGTPAGGENKESKEKERKKSKGALMLCKNLFILSIPPFLYIWHLIQTFLLQEKMLASITTCLIRTRTGCLFFFCYSKYQ